MKEEEIRPQSLMIENSKFRSEDAKAILEHKEEFVKVPCPACESPNYRFVFEKDGFTFVICNDCLTHFINPRPTFEILTHFYESSKCLKHWHKIFSVTENVRRNQIFVPRANKIADLCKKHMASHKILSDVGAGFGTFCEEVKKLGIFERVIAVEPSHDLAEACRSKGIEVEETAIENSKVSEVSVITCFELIEHLFYPKDFLSSCSKILTKNGLLILTTPNIKGFDLLTLGKLSENVAGPNHLNYFHPESIAKLVTRCGFEVIEILTPGKLDAELVRKKILSGQFDVSNQLFLKQILIEQWEKIGEAFQQFLVENNLSSHMWLVARKI